MEKPDQLLFIVGQKLLSCFGVRSCLEFVRFDLFHNGTAVLKGVVKERPTWATFRVDWLSFGTRWDVHRPVDQHRIHFEHSSYIYRCVRIGFIHFDKKRDMIFSFFFSTDCCMYHAYVCGLRFFLAPVVVPVRRRTSSSPPSTSWSGRKACGRRFSKILKRWGKQNDLISDVSDIIGPTSGFRWPMSDFWDAIRPWPMIAESCRQSWEGDNVFSISDISDTSGIRCPIRPWPIYGKMIPIALNWGLKNVAIPGISVSRYCPLRPWPTGRKA